MKKSILNTIILSTLSFGTFAQNVNIPDANFKAYLVGNSFINTNSDTEIQYSEAASVMVLNLSSKSISDLTGIEAFTSLVTLDVNYNSIATLDLSQNTALSVLNCHQNGLTSINLSQNVNLTELHCYFNNLTSIDISNCTALTKVNVGANNILTLDVTSNTLLTELKLTQNNISTLDLSQNPNLTLLQCGGNSLTALDLTQAFNLTYLECNSNNISVLNLMNNNDLTSLYCGNNNLSTLDLSAHPDLAYVSCNDNSLTSLILGQNTSLTNLEFDFNNITSIDLSQNTALTELYCSFNNLQSLNLSQNTALTLFSGGSNNDLTYLNVKNLSPTTLTGFYTYGTPNLICIEVDDVAVATAGWTNIDAASSFSTDCATFLGVTDDIQLSEFSIYPNPSSSSITLQGLSDGEPYQIVNMLGEVVQQGIVNNHKAIDVKSLTSGVYFLNTKRGNVIRFIKE
ncbi:MAG: T9SS type A sorting domain-containing protein [Flavobacteriales bacterium]|nr:T9SS type A sorting domain-containing protein [Flavobacteriales bacterium]